MTILTLKIIFSICVLAVLFSVFYFKRIRSFFQQKKDPENSSFDFYRLNTGNQSALLFAPVYDPDWFATLKTKYSWDKFDQYDNQYYQYIYNLFDPLRSLAKNQADSDDLFFSKLTRGQKVFYCISVFTAEIENGGVYQFFFNSPKFCILALEVLEELELSDLYSDYKKCLDELFENTNSFIVKKQTFNSQKLDSEKQLKSFQEGYADIPSAKNIESYFYNNNFKKSYFKTIVDYIDKNLAQFVK